MTTIGRELSLWKQLANPDEHQLSLFQSNELHPAEANTSVTASIIEEDDLVRRQGHPDAFFWEQHERARRAISDNRKR